MTRALVVQWKEPRCAPQCALVVQPARPSSGVSYAPIAQRIEQTRPKGEMGVQFPLGAPEFGRVKIEQPRPKGWM